MDLITIAIILLGILYLSVELLHKFKEKKELEDSMNVDLTEDEEASLRNLASGSSMAQFYINEKIAHHEIKRKDVSEQQKIITRLKDFEKNNDIETIFERQSIK